MLHWAGVLVLAILQAVGISLFVIPGVPSGLQKALADLLENTNYRRASNVLTVITAVLFAETLFELLVVNRHDETDHEHHHFGTGRMESFKNAVLTGASLIFHLALSRLGGLTKETMKQAVNNQMLVKQADSTRTEYLRLLGEKDPKAGSKEETPEDKLRSQLNDALKAQRKAETEVTAIKKQADNQTETLQKLMQENDQLKNKLKDFDIVFGDKVKKNI
ncbi:hypothetical protein PROFUN_00386 [Planoprotostelium fungivorum]|uniref:Endoplasmic reticulum transmembrane protein n=1 Tax=Planoprotostelium fungivorum TaxID=1890364 RepID=A0A2P6NYB6_9EUKA|nr:hypothetical protein PROFUN_00386 [Planoprotostelium fungivorum]